MPSLPPYLAAMRPVILALALFLGACSSNAGEEHAGRPAPATVFEDPDGQPATLAEFRGKPVLLNLWATWCAPCVKEMPTLDALAVREAGRLHVLTVSMDMEPREKVEAFLAERKLGALDAWHDPQMALMRDLRVTTLPTTILYDSEGREVWRGVGAEDWTSAEAAAILARASPSTVR